MLWPQVSCLQIRYKPHGCVITITYIILVNAGKPMMYYITIKKYINPCGFVRAIGRSSKVQTSHPTKPGFYNA